MSGDPYVLAAFMVCEILGCPHWTRLHEPPWNLSWEHFIDWNAYLLWKHRGSIPDGPSDEERMEYLKQMKEEYGG